MVGDTGVVPHLHVRPAVLADIPAITACYLGSWRAAYEPDLDADVLAAEAEKRRSFEWKRGIDDGSVGVFVAVDADTIVGVVQADLSLPPPRDLPEITMLYVGPEMWGTGIATALLNAGIDWIRQRGGSAARLRVVEAHERARRFYQREGWVIDEGIPPATNDFFRLIYYRRSLGN